MAWPDRRQDALHRTGKSLGERLLREPELKAQRRAAKRRNLHDDAGGAGADRELETPLQCHPPALVARLSAAGPRGDLAASVRSALRSASASPDAGRRRPGSNLVPGIVPRGRPTEAADGIEITSEANEKVTGSLLVGADGVGSTLRHMLN